MTVWAIALLLSTAMLSIPIILVFWRRHRDALRECERKWRDGQAARLESLVDRMKAVEVPAEVYPELPSVPLAGLLCSPDEASMEPDAGQRTLCVD